eukprot:CAMPEP_0171514424 /NCGR_PEP_ID=MMETSP0959-20130129/2836_1 /TAXON_ID=87120 /ORGANISM="Aurantiochytrium limacinum, Strain ATCCMYA-1381" /LENGTH=72 /DNA_ID=CAMNT_0012052747 /DNA_START=233 /DNA_END=451 /DNA_ORIENTATION=-
MMASKTNASKGDPAGGVPSKLSESLCNEATQAESSSQTDLPRLSFHSDSQRSTFRVERLWFKGYKLVTAAIK